ncbi:MAG: type II secretion system minor pseudopilin GspK [Wenzhouxiangella sp.]
MMSRGAGRLLISAGPGRQKGAALLIALMAAALAMVIAVAMMERGQGNQARTQALLASERSYQFAHGMELLAASLMERAEREGASAFLDGRWTPPFDVPGGMIQGRLLDQNARFNLNALAHPDPELAALALERLERLLVHLGLNPLIAVELADWIEGATRPRPGSAGDSWYGAQQPPYRMAGTRLAHVSELRWLRSVDGEAYARLAEFVTALPEPDLLININTTSPVVLASLIEGLDLDQARRVLADGPFVSPAALVAHPVIAALARPGLERHFSVSSPWYLAQARVVLDGVERDYFRLMRRGASGYDFRLYSQGTY